MQCSNTNLRDKLENIFSYSSFAKYLQLDCDLKDILELKKAEVEEKISEALEKLKETQKWYYFNIIDEFTLKGFNVCNSLKEESRGNITSKEYIRIDKDSSRYKNIQWNKLGLEDVTEYFDIRSDYFFNYLVPEMFKCFNEELSSEKIRSFFEEYGFSIEKPIKEPEKASKEEKGAQDIKEEQKIKGSKKTEKENILGDEEVSFLEREILHHREVFLDREKLQDKYNVNISKYLKNKLIVTADRVAHIDRINISLSEEVKLISEKESIHKMKFYQIEEKYPKIIKKNDEIDSKERIMSIIKILER